MSATGTAMAKKSGQTTKGQAAAREAAEKMGAVIVPIGNGGYTLMPKNSAAAKAEQERQRLIDIEKARLAAESANSESPVVETVPAEAKRKNAASKGQPKGQPKATVAEAPAEPVVETPAEPVKVKKPYNPTPLAGAPAAGKAPQKGQLPLGLLRMLVKRNPNSETLKAALAAAESGAPAPAKKGKRAKK